MLKESAQDICGITGASLIVGNASQRLHSFTNDTRSIKEGSTFVCFVGESRDGNDFTCAALEAGASGIVMGRVATAEEIADAKKTGAVLLRARNDDPYAFLQDLARFYRKKEGWLTIGVTGSVGKTTTRQMLKAALSVRYKTFSNEGNFNSVIGVPLTILNAPSDQEVFVCEMGMDHAGEIDAIASVALPNLGCITNIGTAHIGILGSQENIARAKAEIVPWIAAAQCECPAVLGRFQFATARGEHEGTVDSDRTRNNDIRGTLFLDEADAFADFIAQTVAEKEGVTVELLASESITLNPVLKAPYARIQDVVLSNSGTTRFLYVSHTGASIEVNCPFLGEHMAHNALFALAIAEYVGCEPATAGAQIEAMQPTSLRAEMKTLPLGTRLIDDSYNANPASMRAALNLMESVPCAGKKIVVLGEMGELGEQAQSLHEEVGAYAASKHFSACIFVGDENARHMYESAQKTDTTTKMLLVANAADALQELSSILESDKDLILVKGSRFMALDAIAKELNATC